MQPQPVTRADDTSAYTRRARRLGSREALRARRHERREGRREAISHALEILLDDLGAGSTS